MTAAGQGAGHALRLAFLTPRLREGGLGGLVAWREAAPSEPRPGGPLAAVSGRALEAVRRKTSFSTACRAPSLFVFSSRISRGSSPFPGVAPDCMIRSGQMVHHGKWVTPKVAKELGPLDVKRLTHRGGEIPVFVNVGGVNCLLIRILPGGAKSWVLRVMNGGKRRSLGRGSCPTVDTGSHGRPRSSGSSGTRSGTCRSTRSD